MCGEASELTLRDLIDEIAVGPGAYAYSAYFFNCLLRSKVLRANHEDDACDELEGVLQHELFHFAVVAAAPMGPGQEGPADFDLAFVLVVAVESR